MASILTKASQTASTMKCVSLENVKAIETEPEHTFDAIPMKPLEGTKVKTAIEVIKYDPEHGLD